MVKPIRMTIDVEEGFFGKVYRTLDTMPGVASIAIHSEGVKANGSAKAKPQKKGGTQSAYCLVLGALTKAKELQKVDLVSTLEFHGKKASTLPDTMAKLKKAKHISVRGVGKKAVVSITPAGRKHFGTACTIEEAA